MPAKIFNWRAHLALFVVLIKLVQNPILQSGYMVGFYFAYYGIKKLVEKQKQKKELKLAEASNED